MYNHVWGVSGTLSPKYCVVKAKQIKDQRFRICNGTGRLRGRRQPTHTVEDTAVAGKSPAVRLYLNKLMSVFPNGTLVYSVR